MIAVSLAQFVDNECLLYFAPCLSWLLCWNTLSVFVTEVIVCSVILLYFILACTVLSKWKWFVVNPCLLKCPVSICYEYLLKVNCESAIMHTASNCVLVMLYFAGCWLQHAILVHCSYKGCAKMHTMLSQYVLCSTQVFNDVILIKIYNSLIGKDICCHY